MTYKCPKCKASDAFTILGALEQVWCNAFIDQDGDVYDVDGGDSKMEWGPDDRIECDYCDHQGLVREFTDDFETTLVPERQFLLQNVGDGYVGNSPVFWHKSGSGYTQWIDDAKLWTKEEAEKQVQSTRGSHQWQMWDIEEIYSVAKRTVDIQDLRKVSSPQVS